jgi:nucleoside phosphorylase
MILDDLAFKAKLLPADVVAHHFALAFSPDRVKHLVAKPLSRENTTVANNSWLILVAKPNELRVARRVLGVLKQKPIEIDSYPVWQVEEEVEGRIRRIALALIGDQGPGLAQDACRTLLPHIGCGSAILCGMAGGLRGKTRRGDVLVVKEVIDPTPVRREKGADLPRADHFVMPDALWRRMSYFLSETELHWSALSQALSELPPDERPEQLADDWKPSAIQADVLSRNVLVADGSLPEEREDIDEEIRGTEMEAAGVCRACESLRVEWWVMKGVADFGDPDSKDPEVADPIQRKIWQFPATLASVVFALAFIRSRPLV